jgi:hypothetical protein
MAPIPSDNGASQALYLPAPGTIVIGWPVAVPASARLNYEVQGESRGVAYKADAQLSWRLDGEGHYDARLELGSLPAGTRVQTSSGVTGENGLAPERFSDKGSRSEQATHFERDKGLISFSSNKPSVVLLAGAQDRLSVSLQLAALLAGNWKRHPPGSTISLQTAGTSDADIWVFNVEGQELLELPAGAVYTIKMTRKPVREFDQTVELWFAPSLQYLPVRIKITQANGDFVDQQLRASDRL